MQLVVGWKPVLGGLEHYLEAPAFMRGELDLQSSGRDWKNREWALALGGSFATAKTQENHPHLRSKPIASITAILPALRCAPPVANEYFHFVQRCYWQLSDQ